MSERAEYPAPYVTMPFADGEYLFKLGLAQIAELQTKTGTGLGALYARVIAGRYQMTDGALGGIGIDSEAQWFVDDLLHTIRLALIGGNSGTVNGETVNVDPTRAAQLVAAYVFPARPLAEAWSFAAAILTSTIVGYQGASEAGGDDDKKKATDGLTTPAP